MLIAVCITLIVLTILTFSIISEVKVNLDIYGHDNYISFFLFGIRVIKIDIDFVRNDTDVFKLELKNKDRLVATLSLSEVNRNSAKDTLRKALPNPFYNLDIIEIDAYAEYGGDNAFRTVMLVGLIRNLFGAALLYLVSTQKIKTISDVQPNFDNRAIIFRLSGIFSITLADIIIGIIISKKGEKKNDIGK
ncbi:MAG: hypothetical protein J1F36_02620 [Clostridiales bacterium]|nr:hypothetical protein [Clostridiales bacterium]